MDHVAVMKKSWGLLPKILSGEKTIGSRWYKNKSAPWGKIAAGGRVYFKNTGEKVSVGARVSGVRTFENMNPSNVREILEKYSSKDGISRDKIDVYYELFKDKKYCLLIYLENPKGYKQFEINKKGFGSMAAWMCVGNIDEIRGRRRQSL